MNEHNFIEDCLIILTKQTLDKFLNEDNPSELIALYSFYYYTAKWQQTNQPKCTTAYVAKGLHWSENKVRSVKKQLLEFGLIEDIQQRDESQKIIGHYIKMNYIFKKETEKSNFETKNNNSKNHPIENPQGGNNNTMEIKGSNTLSTNNSNALSTNKENNKRFSDDVKIIVDYLNEKAGTNYRPKSKATQQHINARLQEGFTVDEFKTVIDKKCNDWKGTEWEQYLRPATLFGTKFESYLNAKSNVKQSNNQNDRNKVKTSEDYTRGLVKGEDYF